MMKQIKKNMDTKALTVREVTTEEAIAHLVMELSSDPSYRIGWQANIAMAFCDAVAQYRKRSGKKYLSAVEIHKLSNDAANNFINLLCR